MRSKLLENRVQFVSQFFHLTLGCCDHTEMTTTRTDLLARNVNEAKRTGPFYDSEGPLDRHIPQELSAHNEQCPSPRQTESIVGDATTRAKQVLTPSWKIHEGLRTCWLDSIRDDFGIFQYQKH